MRDEERTPIQHRFFGPIFQFARFTVYEWKGAPKGGTEGDVSPGGTDTPVDTHSKGPRFEFFSETVDFFQLISACLVWE